MDVEWPGTAPASDQQESASVDSRPIGVFDSGVGGLTVVREIFGQLPEESVLYLGDTARVPYGPRGEETVTRFALELVQFLLKRDVKALVIACNTVSAVAVEAIREQTAIPVLDVIGPTVAAAVASSQRQVLGVIGTVATVGSGVYPRAVAALRPDARLVAQPCPLFVPIAEEGLGDHPVAALMAEEYLAPLKESGMDALILGCTHYPLLKETLRRTLGPEVVLVDSAEPTARALAHTLAVHGIESSGPPRHQFCVTDASYKFMQIAGRFLGRELTGSVSRVRLEEAPREFSASGWPEEPPLACAPAGAAR
jgi:glutamate racemase